MEIAQKQTGIHAMAYGNLGQENTITLRDGRKLGYAEYGDPTGKPVFLFHGAPGSRLSRHPDASIARNLSARIITVDRPGMGLSSYKPGRRLLDWPADVAELAVALYLDRFAVIGVSGGGPYAAACAYTLPQRLTAVALVSSVGPFDDPNLINGLTREQRLQFTLAKRFPWLVRMLMDWESRRMPATPTAIMQKVERMYPSCDVAVVKQPGMIEMIVEDTREVFRQGARGFVEDCRILASPWGFHPSNITIPVHLWHGEADESVLVATGRYLAQTIPDCHATFYPGEGHLLLFNHWQEILSTVLAG